MMGPVGTVGSAIGLGDVMRRICCLLLREEDDVLAVWITMMVAFVLLPRGRSIIETLMFSPTALGQWYDVVSSWFEMWSRACTCTVY